MTNGFRQNKGPSTKERVKALEVNLQNAQQALNISQMMLKQLMGQIDMLRKDGTNTLNMSNDLQYRTLSMINLLDIDVDSLDNEADKLKLKDYDDASDAEDKEKEYTIGDIIKPESVVILTSTTETEKDQGIFRSKVPVVQIPFEGMKTDIVGKKVGDVFDTDMNGIMHKVEILGIRELPQKLEIVEDAEGKCDEDPEKDCCGKDCEVEKVDDKG